MTSIIETRDLASTGIAQPNYSRQTPKQSIDPPFVDDDAVEISFR
jgi:hypothetical protein